ncbi:MAG: GGDEF domain-containing protein [Rhodospirillales bacterium]|nr:GGDEF domain-containing protein [Rhodospirillales bacterium]
MASTSSLLAPERPAPTLSPDAGRLVACLPVPALLVDRAGAVLAANDAARGLAPLVASQALRLANGEGSGRIELKEGTATRWFDVATTRLDADGVVLATLREATLDQNLRDALVESRQRYRDLVEMSSDFAWETDLAGAFVFVSHDRVLGHATRSMIGRRPADFLIDPQMEGMPLPFDQAEPVDATEFWAVDAQGHPRCLMTVARPVFDAQGVHSGTRGMCRDVTEDRLREADLAQAVQGASVLGHILATMRDAIEPKTILTSACNAIVPALSAAGCRLFRADDTGALSLAVAIGAAPPGLDDSGLALASDDAASCIAADAQYRRNRKGRIVLWRDAEAPGWTQAERALLRKVADQLGVALAEFAEREMLERLSTTDPLTGLLNRRAFGDQLRRRVARAASDKDASQGGALLYVDLDNFKQINDRAGHERGDQALKAVAALLGRSARPTDLIARLGGDEFALWIEGADRAATEALSARLLAAIAEMREFNVDQAKPFGMSIGGAVYDPASGEDTDALVARADAAMYAGKRAGKGRLTLADPAGGGASGA